MADTTISMLITDAAVFLQTGPAEALSWIDTVVRNHMKELGGQNWRPIGDVVARVLAPLDSTPAMQRAAWDIGGLSTDAGVGVAEAQAAKIYRAMLDEVVDPIDGADEGEWR